MLTDLWSRGEGGRQNEVTKNSIHLRGHFYFWLASILTLIGIAFAGAQRARAQSPTYSAELTPNPVRSDDVAGDARIQVLTRPIGALVFLDGEYSMTGRTPYTITHFLKGQYRIRATKPGYENWETDYVFNGQGDDKLSIKMKPKTRSKALLRSMLFPGLGQSYSEHKTRAFAISLMQFSAAGILIYRDSQYTEALNDYNAALQNFQANQKNQDGQADLIAQVKARQTDLDEAYAARKRWLIITGLVYVYNLADAFLFFPSYRNNALDVSVTLDQNPERHGAALELNVQAKF